MLQWGMVKPRECRVCGRKFVPSPTKKGRIDECDNCAVETVQRVAGVTVWEGKHTPVTILCSQREAREYNKATRRPGPAPSLHFTAREDSDNPGLKTDSGAEAGATYRSKLGEARSVKR